MPTSRGEVTRVHISQSHDVYIGRPSEWGNPFVRGVDGTKAEVIKKFRDHFNSNPEMQARARMLLPGKRIACWCKDGTPCHGDVYVEFLNTPQLDFS